MKTQKVLVSGVLAAFLLAAQPTFAATAPTQKQINQIKTKLLQLQAKQDINKKNIASNITKLKTHIDQVKKQRQVVKTKRLAILKKGKTVAVKTTKTTKVKTTIKKK